MKKLKSNILKKGNHFYYLFLSFMAILFLCFLVMSAQFIHSNLQSFENTKIMYNELAEQAMNSISVLVSDLDNCAEKLKFYADDSLEELARYLRQCRTELGHIPAQSEVIGGDLLALRFGSWVEALNYSGYMNCKGTAVSALPLERTALFQAEYKRQSALHVQQKKARKKQAAADRRERKSQKRREKNAAAAGGSK